jgi:hypothetical protein
MAWINATILMVAAGVVIIRTSGPRNATPIAGSLLSPAEDPIRHPPAQPAGMGRLSHSRHHLLPLTLQLQLDHGLLPRAESWIGIIYRLLHPSDPLSVTCRYQ